MNTERAAKLILMLSSDNDGEVLNAARMLKAMDLHQIAEIVRKGGLAAPSDVREAWGFSPADFADIVRSGRHTVNAAKAKAKRESADALRVREQCDQVIARFLVRMPLMERADLDRLSITRFLKKLPLDVVMDAVDIAVGRVAEPVGAFRYFCGICWDRIRESQENVE